MSEEDQQTDDALVSRVRLIEDQPIEQRAESYAQLYEELRTELENADPSRSA